MLRDLRLAIRTLAKQPSFTALAVVTFALGIGADTAIFTVADATLRRSLPFDEPERLVSLTETQKGEEWMPYSLSYPDLRDWQEQLTSFTAIAGSSENGFAVRHGEGSELEVAAVVSSTFFKVLEQPVAQGRTFTAADEAEGAADVLIVTHAYWQTQLGGDAAVIGRVLTLNEKPYTIVGVLPRGYVYGPLDNLGLYAPLKPRGDQRARRNLHWLGGIGRLRPGVTRAAAAAELDAVAARLAAAYPQSNDNLVAEMKPLDEVALGKVRPIIVVLLVAVGLVLIVACANVANLALARATSRRRELAIRAALGASRRRIIGELAAESVVTALAGGALGLVLAMWGVDALVGIIPRRMVNAMPWLIGLSIDAWALGFAFVLALVVGVIVGIVPGLAASRHDLQSILGEEARTTPGRARARLSDVLVAAEVALAFMLVVGAALFGRSLLAMTRVDPGFNTHDALTVRLALSESKHKDDPALVAGHAELLRRLESVPGVRAAASVGVLPLTGSHQTVNYRIVGRDQAGNNETAANIRNASASYFQVAGVPLRAGRYFTSADGPGGHVVVVNEAFAAREFPGEDAVGKHFVFTFKDGLPPMEIVGVVADQRTGLDEKTPPAIFEPYAQSPDNFVSLFLRISGDAGPLSLAVRHEIAAYDPGTAVLDMMTMDERVSRTPYMFVRHFPAILVGAFAALAVVLAVVGLYGVLTYAVGQRQHEIGIRRAVGASERHIARLVLGRALAVVGFGLAAGAVIAVAGAGLLRNMLYGIGAHDPLTFAGTAFLVVLTALVACVPPVLRAMRVDPMEALRR